MQKHQRVAVYGFILNNQNELLLVQRAQNDSMPGIWEIPGGGLEFGEQPPEGVRREVLEETGLNIKPLYPLYAGANVSKRRPNWQTIRIAYFCQTEPEDIILSSDHAAFKWVDLAQIPQENLSTFVKNILNSGVIKKVLA